MPEVVIHNGKVLVDGVEEHREDLAPPQQFTQPKTGSGTPEDSDPNAIVAKMANTISLGMENKLTPMEICNSLLTLNSPAGHKLVFTRFDLLQIFANFTRKMSGREKT